MLRNATAKTTFVLRSNELKAAGVRYMTGARCLGQQIIDFDYFLGYCCSDPLLRVNDLIYGNLDD